jgi:hypothetical protein
MEEKPVQLRVVPRATPKDALLSRIISEIKATGGSPEERRVLAYSLGHTLMDLAFHGSIIIAKGDLWDADDYDVSEMTL